MALRITVAGADNWNEISNISMKSGYEDYINKVGPTYLDDGIVLLSYIDETASGFLKLEEMPDNSAWLSGIRVLPEFRRMHIGSNLTEKAIELARSQGLIMARMLIHAENYSSLSLAQKVGFSKVCKMAFFRGVSTNNMTNIQTMKNYPTLLNLGWKFVKPIDSVIEKVMPNMYRSKNGSEIIEIGNSYQITQWGSDLDFNNYGFSCMEVVSKLSDEACPYLLDDFDFGLIFEKKIQ